MEFLLVMREPTDGFEPFDFTSWWSAELSRRLLFTALRESIQSSLRPEQYLVPPGRFTLEISLIMQRHPEGEELLVIQPYSLRALRQTGFLVDFRFRLGQEIAFNRKVQQLSLSLDKKFRRNADHRIDRTAKIGRFLEERWRVFENIKLTGVAVPLRIRKEFVALTAERLRPKVYIFAANRESRSQFAGLRDFGPLKPLEAPTKLLFAFRERDRPAARRLAVALRGLKQQGHFTFPGFKSLFKTDVEIDPEPIVLPDVSVPSMEHALERAQGELRKSCPIVPVLVLPDGQDNGYFAQKALFSHSGMPTQVCTLKVLEDEELLKWSIANLALQIFCKAGGQPWKVRPTAERSLIIGISQSHKNSPSVASRK